MRADNRRILYEAFLDARRARKEEGLARERGLQRVAEALCAADLRGRPEAAEVSDAALEAILGAVGGALGQSGGHGDSIDVRDSYG